MRKSSCGKCCCFGRLSYLNAIIFWEKSSSFFPQMFQFPNPSFPANVFYWKREMEDVHCQWPMKIVTKSKKKWIISLELYFLILWLQMFAENIAFRKIFFLLQIAQTLITIMFHHLLNECMQLQFSFFVIKKLGFDDINYKQKNEWKVLIKKDAISNLVVWDNFFSSASWASTSWNSSRALC